MEPHLMLATEGMLFSSIPIFKTIAWHGYVFIEIIIIPEPKVLIGSPEINPFAESRDIDLRFTVNPITNRTTVLEDDIAIKNAIKNLVLLNKGERHFTSIGSSITDSLFENPDSLFLDSLTQIISTTIKKYEPRANRVKITSISDSFDSVRLELQYQKNDETDAVVYFSIMIKRGR